MRRTSLLLAAVMCGCVSTAVTRESIVPVPEHPARGDMPAHVRGTPRDAARVATDDQYAIIAEVVNRFFRPMMQQARWIDPRPLADERSVAADSAERADNDWALAIVEAVDLRRVCPLTEANDRCLGLAGGVLRFSRPYAVGAGGRRADSAIVYAQYAPKAAGPLSELEFFLARRNAEWVVVSRRSMPDRVAAGPARYVVTDPAEMVDSLLAADRAFAAAGRSLDIATTLSNMFVTNVVMPTPTGHVRGRDSASTYLESLPDNARSRITWTPIRGGVSSDLKHGFTFGYTTITRPDGTQQPGKYVAYWVRGDGGWRVAAYRRTPRPAGEVSLALLPPSLPQKGLSHGDEGTVQRYADELSAAEHAFSRDATPMGIGPAFVKWGAPDAVNVGGPTNAEFVRGNEAIGQSVSAGFTAGTKISWAPEQVIVASSGDLGVSIGMIHVTTPASATAAEVTRHFPFFTIWKRQWPTDPWRYVAE